eukprot:gene1164-biopygen1250
MIREEDLVIKSDKVLGSGGFGTVYGGRWRTAIVAVKVFDESMGFPQDFEREAYIMKDLRHPNIVDFYGYCTGPTRCIVIKYMQQGSLTKLLHSRRDISWDVRIKIALDMARGLEYLHSENILHRDIKSMNVLLNENGGACLADFGLARANTVSFQGLRVKVGTLNWMAPEVKASGVYTWAADVYSLGITFWELATRRIPTGLEDDIPDECPGELAVVIERCREERPNLRPSASGVLSEFFRDLKDIMNISPKEWR